MEFGRRQTIIANSRELRDPFTLYYSSEVINDEEFILLYGVFSSKSLNLPYEDYQRFSFDHMKPDECKAEFRFWKNDIPLPADVLQIPADLVCSQGTIFGGLEGLCILLRRLAYPCRYSDLFQRFGRPVPELSMIRSTVMNYIYENHQQRMTNWNQTFLNPAKLEEYAQAISDSGAALKNCFGFIDGTVRPICNVQTRNMFLWEFKRRILMQSWYRLTDIVILYWHFLHIGEEAWFRHACRFRTAQIYFFHQRGPSLFVWRFCLPLRVHLQTPFCIVAPNPLMQEYHRSMSSDRISVEWIFGVISSYLKFVDLKKIWRWP